MSDQVQQELQPEEPAVIAPADAQAKQAEMYRRYVEQLRQMCCVGCGETLDLLGS
jgi:hypothetical protein